MHISTAVEKLCRCNDEMPSRRADSYSKVDEETKRREKKKVKLNERQWRIAGNSGNGRRSGDIIEKGKKKNKIERMKEWHLRKMKQN